MPRARVHIRAGSHSGLHALTFSGKHMKQDYFSTRKHAQMEAFTEHTLTVDSILILHARNDLVPLALISPMLARNLGPRELSVSVGVDLRQRKSHFHVVLVQSGHAVMIDNHFLSSTRDARKRRERRVRSPTRTCTALSLER